MSRTYAIMGVSASCHAEIKQKLVEAGYEHAIMEDDELDMQGIALAPETLENVDLHPSVQHLLQFFSYEHLPEHLQEVSRPFCELAQGLVRAVPSNAETTVALRKLLEAKDCAVRALLAE